jgi:hypothetical protein
MYTRYTMKHGHSFLPCGIEQLAPSNPQGVLLEFLSPFHSTYDVETMGEHNELPLHVLEKPPIDRTFNYLK